MAIVGRETELAAIGAALGDADCAGVLLTGEAGIGKSHLAGAIAARHDADGDDVRRVYPNVSAGELPFGGLTAGFTAGDAYNEMAGAATAVKRNLTESGRRVVIVIDDVDGLDAASAAVLANVADAGLARLVMTQRTGTVVPPAVEQLLTTGAVWPFVCSPLDEAATGDLARSIAGADLTSATCRRIFATTLGNPLYVRELVEAAREEGTLRVTASGAALDEVPGRSTRLIDLLERRLRNLRTDERDALRYIAAAGSVSQGVLAPFVDAGTLAALESKGLVETLLDGRRLSIRPAHPLHGEILRSAEAPLALRSMRTQLAERIAEVGMRRADDRFRLATWTLEGIGTVTPDVLTEAAGMAKAAGEFGLAARLARAAHVAEPTFEHARLLAHMLYDVGDWPSLRAALDDAETLVETDADLAAYQTLVATSWFWRGADAGRLHEFLPAWDDWPAGELGDGLRATGASLLILEGRIDEAVERAERLRDLPPSVSAVQVAMTLGHGWRSQGRPLTAAALVDETLSVYREFGPDVFALSSSLMAGVRILALADAGEFAHVDRMVAEGSDAWRDAGDSSNVALAHLAHGWSWFLRGNLDRAAQLASEAAVGFELDRHPGMRRWAMILLAQAHAQSADPTSAEKVIAEIDASPPHPAAIFEPYLWRARGWTLWHRGHGSDSADAFARGWDTALEAGNVLCAIGCAHDLARTGEGARAVELIGLLDVVELEGRFAAAQLAHIEATARPSADGLGRCAETFATIGSPHLAAECATLAAAAPDASPRDTKQWLQRAAEWSGADAAQIEAALSTARLTKREREVVGLVLLGLTSREAAERLEISRRTVETHLGNAYTKLGVNDRIGLIEHLRPVS